MSFFKTIFSKAFAKHLGIIFLSGIILIILTFVVLNVYTRHGKGFEVPDFSGLTEQQFQHLIEKNDLRYSIIDSIHTGEVPPGVVVEQSPKPGSLVKKNRNIFFTINAWTPEQIQMPDVIDYSIRNARVMLESFGLELGKLIYVPSEYTNLVLGQHYNGKPVDPGTPLTRGSSIDLIVGQGLSNQRTAVPDLFGLTREEAKDLSQNVSLNIGAVIYDNTITSREDSLNALVWKQRPTASRQNQVRLGSSIDIWLTTDSTHFVADSAAIQNIQTDSEDSQEINSNDISEFEEEEEFF